MLYLFSSNAQPQYSQDILDVIAAPVGYKVRFRYDAQYVNAAAQASWGTALVGQEVLVHFALQQQHEYFTPVVFPIRRGRVVDARKDGTIHLIDFVVDEPVSLGAPDNPNRHNARAAAYRETLVSKGVELPYESYAVLAEYDAVRDAVGSRLFLTDQPAPNHHEISEVFRLTAEYLAFTETFATARFLLVASMRKSNGAEVKIDDTTHGYRLTAGDEYELQFLQAQPAPVTTPSVIDVVLDGDALQAVGPSELSISSKYDVPSIRIFVPPLNSNVRHTTIGVRPRGETMGPILNMPVEIRPNNVTRAGVVAATALSVVALGLPAILTKWSVGPKIALVAIATVLAGTLNAFRLSTKSI